MSASSHDSDPLLRAVASGDEHCPDGRALARLGRLVRGQAPAPSDLRPRLSDRLAVDEADLTVDETARIDRHVEHGDVDPELARLGDLLATVKPAAADLRDRVRRQLTASMRLAPVSSEAPVSTRAEAQRTAQRDRRLRLILGVVAVHVAALLVFALFQVGPGQATSLESHSAWTSAKPVPNLPEHLPADWNELGSSGFDLLGLRRSPAARAAACARFGMERSSGAVACGLRWLLAAQGADGFIGTRAGDHDADLASHALATLALLGEGGGPTASDHERLAAIARALPALAVDDSTAAVPRSLATLAQIEAALLGIGSRQAAEAALADLRLRLPAEPGVAGLGGFALLAVETATQAGYTVPPRLLEQSRNTLGRQLPVGDGDPGRLGLAAFARLVLGYRENPSTATLLDALAANRPTPAAGDALGWFFATLALRESGGLAWETWATALQESLVPAFVDAGPGLSRVPAAAVRHAPNEVFATAIAVLDLQVAYRYLPTASGAPATPPAHR